MWLLGHVVLDLCMHPTHSRLLGACQMLQRHQVWTARLTAFTLITCFGFQCFCTVPSIGACTAIGTPDCGARQQSTPSPPRPIMQTKAYPSLSSDLCTLAEYADSDAALLRCFVSSDQTCMVSGLVVSCLPMGGAFNSGRNIQYWDQALTAARSHGDLYLEALTTKNLGIVASMEYG